jgi:hypothetical protein
MPRPARVVLVLLLVLATTLAGCGAPTSSSSGRSSGSSSTRCLDRGNSAGQGALGSSEEPDRPIFFLFCVQSP